MITLDDKLNEYLNELPRYVRDYINSENERLSVKSRIAYTLDLKIFLIYIVQSGKCGDIKKVTIDMLDDLNDNDMNEYIRWLSHYKVDDKEYTNNSAGKKRKLASVRAFFKYLRKIGKMKNNPTEFTVTPVVREKEIVVLSQDEQSDMLSNVVNGTNKTGRQLKFHEKTKLRDLAIIFLFLGTGIRVSELVGLNDTDIDLQEQRALVVRKGGKRSFVYFSDDVIEVLSDYMENERNMLLGYKDGKAPEGLPLFVSLKKQRLSVRMVEVIIKNYARFILPPSVKVTPHTLRKTYGTLLYNKYKDLYLTQNALGHASPATTAKYYTKWNEDYLKKLKEYDVKRS